MFSSFFQQVSKMDGAKDEKEPVLKDSDHSPQGRKRKKSGSSSSKDLKCVLEDFRAEWKREIKTRPVEGDVEAKSGPSKAHDSKQDKRIIDCDESCVKDSSVTGSTFDGFTGTEDKETRTEIKAFLITEELLRKGSEPKSLKELDALTSKHPSSSPSIGFTEKKRIRLSSDAPKVAASERILDMFLSDLVCATNNPRCIEN
jgi:hypothetical protein